MTDVLGRPWQMGTIQLDFQQPIRFELKFTDKDGQEKTPIAIHRVIYGSLERFIGILIEHLAGKFPVWLAPEQLRIITLNQEQTIVDFANTIADQAKKLGVRATVDAENESVGKKIRSAEMMKIPYTVVVGPKELETNEMVPRIRKDMEVDVEHPPRTPYELVKTLANEAKTRINKTSL
jgi:threonyl-tRNA synthetase